MSKFWSNPEESSLSSSESEEDCSSLSSSEQSAQNSCSTTSDVSSSDPNEAWKRISKDQVFLEPPTTTGSTPNCKRTRIVCISDTHGQHREIAFLPRGDILVHAGDFTKSGETGTVQDLSKFFQEQKANFKHIICIAGNHDMTFHPEFYATAWRRHSKPFDPDETRKALLSSCIYLQDSSYTLTETPGTEIYGSPWTPEFYDWAFNLPRGQPLLEVWNKIPTSTDVLVTHGPPLGRGDFTDHSGYTGCLDLLNEVQRRVHPRLHIFGHVHQSYGSEYDGRTLFVNASSMGSDTNRATNRCIVVDLPHDETKQAMIVKPTCQIGNERELHAWLKENHYNSIVERMEELESFGNLPTGNALLDESALGDISAELALHRDRNAFEELRRALCQLHAESFLEQR